MCPTAATELESESEVVRGLSVRVVHSPEAATAVIVARVRHASAEEAAAAEAAEAVAKEDEGEEGSLDCGRSAAIAPVWQVAA